MNRNHNHHVTRTRSAPHPHICRPRPETDGGRVEVELMLEAPRAAKVFVAGDFNHWLAGDVRLRRDQEGIWRGCLWLEPGRYEYRFIVDAEWQDDPRATTRVPNEFGTTNCVLDVKG